MGKPRLTVAVLCEESGKVRDAFRRLGHEAYSCDLVESREPSDFHIIGDALDIGHSRAPNGRKWDLAITHGPCTFIANSSAKHLYKGMNKANGVCPVRWENMQKGALFFKALLDLPIEMICSENPIMLGHAKDYANIPDQDQVIQPWMHGQMFIKATCLWLKNLPLLEETDNVYDQMMLLPYAQRAKVHHCPPGPLRQRIRSETEPGIAAALAMQYGGECG
ncbi:MAG: hypothetical protein V4563_17330 [Pseudomonadota bacterium]